jgi:predicted nucleic acid-binding Zn ribbon protein
MSKEKICPICGNVLESNRKKYCSIECRNKAYIKSDKPKIYYSCEWCGVSLPKDSTNKYCSEDCERRATGYKEPKKRGRKKKVLSLTEINKLAQAKGLTYGQYIAKYGG